MTAPLEHLRGGMTVLKMRAQRVRFQCTRFLCADTIDYPRKIKGGVRSCSLAPARGRPQGHRGQAGGSNCGAPRHKARQNRRWRELPMSNQWIYGALPALSRDWRCGERAPSLWTSAPEGRRAVRKTPQSPLEKKPP